MVEAPTPTEAGEPPPEAARIAALLGWRPSAWRSVFGGYTPARRYLVADGERSAFAKVATSVTTADMLRREARAYETASGAFMPRFIGWSDDAEAPLLVIEDLSEAVWPPPWTSAMIEQVLGAVEAMHAVRVDLPTHAFRRDGVSQKHFDPHALDGWTRVAREPARFLALRVASAEWLAEALPALARAEALCRVDGEALTHYDLRSDNICIAASGVKLVDWAAASAGNPTLDLGFWLPSLELEGGPAPDAILSGHAEVAAAVSGYFAARAGLPIIPDAPRVRHIQRAQLTRALPWAQRALGLPALS